MRRGWIVGCLFAAATTLGGGGAARACVGDCTGDGVVTVTQLIIGVRISLGEASLTNCPAFDANADGVVSIEELVAAVAAALGGCPATPSPSVSDTPTPTAADTPTPTATATPTAPPTSTVTQTSTVPPTVPPESGRWREDPLAVTDSTCVALLTQQFAADLAARSPCEQSVEVSSATTATLVDCTGTRVDGTLDHDGTLHFPYAMTGDTTNGCTVALTTSAVIPAAVSPTTATYTFAIAFSGTCPLTDCTITAQGAWTRE